MSKRISLLLLLAIAFACWAQASVRPLAELPEELRLVTGQPLRLRLPGGVTGRLEPADRVARVEPPCQGFATLSPVGAGRARLEFRLLGLLPVGSVVVHVIPETRVMVGGHSIGVVVSSRGVLVTGVVPVPAGGAARSPAQEAGIQVGDLLLSANGVPLRDEEDLATAVRRAGERGDTLTLEVERQGRSFRVAVRPVGLPDGSFRIGLSARDATAGVGTLTLWDPVTRRFAALGHLVTDPDSGRPISLEEGRIVLARVLALRQGKRGEPGEKIGVFLPEKDALGAIDKNTDWGIIGTLHRPLANPLYPEPVLLGGAGSVREGPAQVLTVVNGQTIEAFSAYIQKVWPDRRYQGKGLVLRITDSRLREKAGGIVQGMSGSPILQDGRLVGAVTHVFVGDPTRGYGVLAQWMWEEMAPPAAVKAE